jgi:hypothetical protein
MSSLRQRPFMLIHTQPVTDFSSGMPLGITSQSFYEAYCWVVFSHAIGESKLVEVWPDLVQVYAGFDPSVVNQDVAYDAEEWLAPEATLGPSQCALMIQLLGWEQFCQQFVKTNDPKQTLTALRGLDWMSVQQLGRLLDMEWAD